jgi:predicted metal-dependent enzyme (double-stranded beta helix superfamily)
MSLVTTAHHRHLHSLPGAAVAPDPSSPLDASPRLDLDSLGDIVSGLARAVDLWRPHVAHDADERARIRLLATPAYEVWLLGWTAGQSVGLHDHGGSNGAFVVVDGELTETFAVDGAHPRGRLADRTVPVGNLGTVPAGAVHDLANRSTALATSLHVYSRPLQSMGFFDDAEPGVRGHRIRTMWVDETPAVLDDRHFAEHWPA